MTAISSTQITQWLEQCAAVFEREKERLTELDSDIGDGDHGANMARGFTAVKAKLPTVEGKDIGTIFKTVAMTLISTVGGASGPLYGTFFLQAATAATGKSELSGAEFAACFEAGVKGLVARGKAVIGEKTMVDALLPAAESLLASGHEAIEASLLKAVEAVRQGADSTIPLVARKGRASYLGGRSAGHLDPGASSSVLLLETLAATLGIQV
ncbi:MAG: dihydroxyacetone kinase subunit DhaL [Chthoniobacteraceae bacterium]